MRTASAILLSLLLLSAMLREALVYALFKLNQDYIAAQLCVERDKAESTCKGHCYLSSQLAAAQDPAPDSTLPLPELGQKLALFLVQAQPAWPLRHPRAAPARIGGPTRGRAAAGHAAGPWQPPEA